MRALLLLALACAGKDEPTPKDSGTDTTEPPPASLRLVGDDATMPPAAALAIWASGDDDVWIVGSDDGAGPLLLHHDGAGWERLSTGTRGDLWWIWSPDAETFFLAGASGRVVVFDRRSGVFTEQTVADSRLTLFGLWGTSTTDVWAVGGDPRGDRDGAMLHFDGDSWSEVAQPGGANPRGAFKVWGRATDDLWVVGTGGLLTHWDGLSFTEVEPSPVFPTTVLTTLTGDQDQVVAVGGTGNAVVARLDDAGWTNDSPPPEAVAPTFTGVHTRDGRVVACGNRGAHWEREGDAWIEVGVPATSRDYHACWITPSGHVWAVGGDLITLTAGVVATDDPDVPVINL